MALQVVGAEPEAALQAEMAAVSAALGGDSACISGAARPSPHRSSRALACGLPSACWHQAPQLPLLPLRLTPRSLPLLAITQSAAFCDPCVFRPVALPAAALHCWKVFAARMQVPAEVEAQVRWAGLAARARRAQERERGVHACRGDARRRWPARRSPVCCLRCRRHDPHPHHSRSLPTTPAGHRGAGRQPGSPARPGRQRAGAALRAQRAGGCARRRPGAAPVSDWQHGGTRVCSAVGRWQGPARNPRPLRLSSAPAPRRPPPPCTWPARRAAPRPSGPRCCSGSPGTTRTRTRRWARGRHGAGWQLAGTAVESPVSSEVRAWSGRGEQAPMLPLPCCTACPVPRSCPRRCGSCSRPRTAAPCSRRCLPEPPAPLSRDLTHPCHVEPPAAPGVLCAAACFVCSPLPFLLASVQPLLFLCMGTPTTLRPLPLFLSHSPCVHSAHVSARLPQFHNCTPARPPAAGWPPLTLHPTACPLAPCPLCCNHQFLTTCMAVRRLTL